LEKEETADAGKVVTGTNADNMGKTFKPDMICRIINTLMLFIMEDPVLLIQAIQLLKLPNCKKNLVSM